MIELRQLSKRFGQRWAVSELDLTVRRGEIFGLLGHNGAGKSTAIGMMLGQVWPTAGEVKVCGHEVTTHRQQALQNVGAIFETPVFYDYMSGWRNLETLSQYSAPTPPERLREVVAWVGLSGREHAKVRTYSHGMRTRLALAQALLPQPELLILDEPGDGLDPEGIHEMRQTILRLRDELKLTILLSSHLLNEVEQLCDRIAVLDHGKKIFEGALSEAKRPRNWVRLNVGDFALAVRRLTEDKLIADSRDGQSVEPSPGVGTDALVKRLVELGVPVFEVVREEQTLEGFYLHLMQESRGPD
ncbi:MAG: ABC transporter ATP-binding protein, partial [Verrucomicrobia bacterium]|nr:ABC transporter ATP-binding protein [Verrucomicrobiota bacterium]